MKETWKHRLAAFGMAGALALAMAPMAAMAADGDDPSAETPTTQPTSALKADTKISVSGIDPGDSAAYYQIIEQDETTKAWKLTSAFAGLDLTNTDGNKAINNAIPEGKPKKETLDFIFDGIDADEAGVIAEKASGAGTDMPADAADKSKHEASVVPGLYLVIITPAANNKDVVYKPVFVAADYSQENNNNTQDEPDSTVAKLKIGGADGAVLTTAVAKKSPLELTKTASTEDEEPDGVAVGDVISFTVNTNLVTYTENFKDPKFIITDKLSKGLVLTDDEITVKVGNKTPRKNVDYTIATTERAKDSGSTEKVKDGYVITFKPDYLYTQTGDPKVVIEYKAKVTDEAAPWQVNQMDNTVTLEFTNDPKPEAESSKLEDKTRHYTFDIDGNIFGSTGGEDAGKTKEVEKVGVDADGNPIEVIKSDDYATKLPEKHSPLAGATFELQRVTKLGNDGKPSEFEDVYFKNNIKSTAADGGSKTLTSETDGSIPMKGLDEGTYILKEKTAPLGYSFDPEKEYVITISANYGYDADGYKTLLDYTITVNGNESKYRAGTDEENEGKPIPLDANTASITPVTDDASTADKDESPQTTLIINKKLGVLPSTGGSGILFYVGVGAAIMALAIALSRRGRKANTPAHGITA